VSITKRIRSAGISAAVILGGVFLQDYFRDSIQSSSRLSGVVVDDLVSTNSLPGRFFSNDGYFRDPSGNRYVFGSLEGFLSVAEGDTLELSVKDDYMRNLFRIKHRDLPEKAGCSDCLDKSASRHLEIRP
jgi:hypothetical protein